MIKKIKSIFNYFSDNIYESFLAFIALLNVLPILAPILAKIGLLLPSKIIYYIYSFFCHQLHWRSIHVCDYQYGWCTRCTFMWLNVLLSGLAVKYLKIRNIKWYWALVLIFPMALDGLIQTIATVIGVSSINSIEYMSNNFIRMLTGSLFGLGFGLLIFTNLNNTTKEKRLENKEYSKVKFVLLSLLISIITYISLIFIWDISSSKYKPSNILDFAVKTPVNSSEFIERGKNIP